MKNLNLLVLELSEFQYNRKSNLIALFAFPQFGDHRRIRFSNIISEVYLIFGPRQAKIFILACLGPKIKYTSEIMSKEKKMDTKEQKETFIYLQLQSFV